MVAACTGSLSCGMEQDVLGAEFSPWQSRDAGAPNEREARRSCQSRLFSDDGVPHCGLWPAGIHDAWSVRFDTILKRGRARHSQLSKPKIRMEGTWNRTTRGVQDRRPETAASPGAAAAEGGPLHWQPAPCRWLQVWALRHTGQVPPGLGCRDSHVDPCAVSFQKDAPGPPFGPTERTHNEA